MFKSTFLHLFDRFRRLDDCSLKKDSCSNLLLTIYPISSDGLQIGCRFDKNLLFSSKFQPIENNRSSARKVPVEITHRRALDLSENGTPTCRSRGSMPIGSLRSTRRNTHRMATWVCLKFVH
jgi:hypothetical protein